MSTYSERLRHERYVHETGELICRMATALDAEHGWSMPALELYLEHTLGGSCSVCGRRHGVVEHDQE